MKPPVLHVSDHALVRYLERVVGVNVDGLRARIIKRANVAAVHGADAVTIEGVRYCIRNGVVTTVTPPRGQRGKRRARKGRKK